MQCLQQRGYSDFCILPLRKRRIGGHIPGFADKLRSGNFPLNTIVSYCAFSDTVRRRIFVCRNVIHNIYYRHK